MATTRRAAKRLLSSTRISRRYLINLKFSLSETVKCPAATRVWRAYVVIKPSRPVKQALTFAAPVETPTPQDIPQGTSERDRRSSGHHTFLPLVSPALSSGERSPSADRIGTLTQRCMDYHLQRSQRSTLSKCQAENHKSADMTMEQGMSYKCLSAELPVSRIGTSSDRPIEETLTAQS